MAKVREIRVSFSEDELNLYNFISAKSSKAGFLKDLASLEMKREELYTSCILNEAGKSRPADQEIPEVDKEEKLSGRELNIDDIMGTL